MRYLFSNPNFWFAICYLIVVIIPLIVIKHELKSYIKKIVSKGVLYGKDT